MDGRNYRPKHVELIGIINKPLLLHLVGCLYYCISDTRSYKNQIYTIAIWNLSLCNSHKPGYLYFVIIVVTEQNRIRFVWGCRSCLSSDCICVCVCVYVYVYVLLTLHPCIISQISPTRYTVLFNIFIYFSSLHVSGVMRPSSGEKYCIYATLALVTLKGGSFKITRIIIT